VKFADQHTFSRRRISSSTTSTTRERDRRRKLAQRKLLLESLENRSLLATIDLVVNLYADNGGVPGALIANDTVTPGQEFWVEVTAKDTSAVPSGINGLAIDVGFSAAAFDEIDNPFDPAASTTIITSEFPLFRGGDLDNNAGTIDELRGASLPNLGQGDEIGETKHDRFALLKFKANAAVANSPFTIAIGTGSVAFADGSSLDNATIEAQTITVTDTAPPPTLTIDDVTANEGSDGTTTSFTFTVTLSPASTGTVLVQVDTKDVSAIAPGDYETITGQVLTFNAGETTKTVTVKVVADKLNEPIETFQVNLSKADGANIGDATGIGTILNDDTITASITKTISQVEGNAGNTNYDFTVTLDSTAATDVVIPWTFANVDSEDEDFSGLTKSGKVTIPAGQLTAKIPSFAVIGENVVELDETFTVTLETPETAGVVLSSDKVGTGTIQNDDSATIIITGPAATLEGNAGNTPVEFTVTLSAPSDVPVSVNFQTKDGTATVAGNDYSPTTGKITFEAGKSGTIKIPVNILGDTSVEANETFSVLLDTLDVGTPARNVTLQTDTATATITDDDAVAITIQSVSIEEGNAGTKNLKFSVALTNAVAGEVSVDLATQDGTATAGVDYTATNKTITFPANSTTAIDFEVPISGDNVVELDEAFTVLLSNLQSGAFTVNLPAGPITGTITNDDSATVTLTPVSQNEENTGTKNMVFTATLSNPVDVDFTVDFATSDGTATLVNNDYTETKQTLTFTKGGPLTQTINVPIIGDTTVETDETFTATLSNVQASGRNVTAGNPVTGTIIDDDEEAPVANISDVAILEGNSGETLLVFTVTLTKANPLADVLVEVSTADITALAGTDYTAIVNQAVTIAKDTTSKTVTVKLNGDTLIENDETFKLSITKIDGAKIGDGEAIGTITNDDTATATIDSVTQLEGNAGTTNFDFTVTIDKTAAFDVVIPWSFSHVDSEDSDFGAGLTKSGKVTIPAGSTSAKITPSSPVNGDTTLETNEKFSITLGTPENAAITLGGAKIGEGTITNDDQVTVSINNVTDMEPTVGNTKNFDFTVSLNQAAEVDVVVPWTFTNLTTLPEDFGAGLTTTGKVTIPAGQTSAPISGAFPVAGDLVTEVNETFRVALSAPETAGAVLSTDNKVGIGTIVDADTAVVASIDSKTLLEGNAGTTAFDFTVTLDKASPVDVVIPWTFANGTTLDTDFSAGLTKSGKVTIPANQLSAKISFSVIGDTVLENNETFTVTLGTPETPNASVNANSKIGTGTINNDDQVAVTINSINDVEPANGNTKNYDFTVTLSAAADIDVVVPWSFTNVTTADADFGAGLTKTGKVTIPAGQTSAKITGAFPVAGDLLSEAAETFTVTLAAPETAGAVLANNNTVGTGTINDVVTVVASIDNKTLAEGNSGTTAFDFTVTLDKAAAVDVVIPWTFANVTTLDNDFGAGLTKSGKVTIPAGQLSAKITPTFPVNGDTLLEANETFTVTLGTPETANTIVSDTAKVGTGTVTNDDQVTVSITDKVQQTEGNSGTKNFDFTVTIDQAAAIDVVVPYTFAHVTTNAADFTGLTTTGKVTIPAGQTSVKVTPTFAVNGDTSLEADETFTVTLSTPETSGAVLSATAKVGTGTIQNDDSIVASINAVSKAEGNSGTTNFDFEVTLDQVAAVDVVIPWTFTHVTTADSDFGAGLTKSGKVTIPAGQTKATITPSFPMNGDTLVELDETFTVTLGTPETANVTLSSTSKIGTGTVQNDDTATASIKAVTQAEGNSGNTNFDFTVTLDKAASVDVTVPYTFAHVTTKDNDFAGSLTKTGNVTIPAGQTSIKIPSFAVLGDTTVEADETFTVTLGTPDRSSVVLSATEKVGTGTVTNDDSATISIGSATVIEPTSGTSTITLPITMSQPADVDVTVTYTFTNGSTSDADFATLTKTGTVVIPAGQTSPTTPLTFTVATDAIDEPDETFTVTLSNPTFAGGVARNVTIPAAGATGTGTIQEDPGTGKLSGFAYVDGNNNGVKDAGEVGIPGVTITLTGTPTGGSAITLTAMTADDGSYSFTGLTGGKYEITETQPATMFDGIDVVGTQGGTLANDKITGIVLDAAEEGTGNNFGELGLLPQFVTKRLFLASTPAAAQTLRVLNGRAAEIAGNQTLADQIFNATVPSVVSAGGAAAAVANNNGAAPEFIPEDNNSAGEFVPAATNSAGEYIPDDAAVIAAQQQAAAANNSQAKSAATTKSTTTTAKTTKTTTPKTAVTKTAAPKNKVTTPKSATAKTTVAKTTTAKSTTSATSKRSTVLQALRSENSTNSSAVADALQMLAIDEVIAREKKWR
jgi:hypothetical protein